MSRLPEEFNRYFEPFVGGGALFFALQPRAAYLSDVTADLMNAYCVVRDEVESLIEDLQRHIYDREYFERIRAADRQPEFRSWAPVARASRLIYLNKTCFNGLYRLSNKGYFNTPFGRYASPTILNEPNLRACSSALQGTQLVLGSFEQIENIITPDDFVYFDPPYVPLNETSSFIGYSQEKFADTLQQSLFDLCCRLDHRGIRFMLSNSSHPWVLETYRRFQLEIIQANRAINSKAALRGKIDEVIVRNY